MSKISRIVSLIIVLPLIALFILTTDPFKASTATTYYVATTGSDTTGNGTSSNPWRTLAYAVTKVPSGQGHIIHLKSGTFVETSPISVPVGVNIEGEGADYTIIKSNISNALIKLESSSKTSGSQWLKNFKIDGDNKKLDYGISIKGREWVEVHGIVFSNCEISGLTIMSTSASAAAQPSFYIKGIKVYNCTFNYCGKDYSNWTSGNLMISGTDGGDIYNINITDNQGYGIKFNPSGYGWIKGTKIHDCTISVNEYDALWGSDAAIEIWNPIEGCEIYNVNSSTWFSIVDNANLNSNPTNTIKVHDNRIVYTRNNNDTEGIEFQVGGGECYNNYIENTYTGIALWGIDCKYQLNNIIRHNVIYNPKAVQDEWHAGIWLWSTQSKSTLTNGTKIYHNVIDGTARGVWLKCEWYSLLKDTKIRNNIFINLQDSAITTSDNVQAIQNTTATNNCYYNVPMFLHNYHGQTYNFYQSNNYNNDPGLKKTGNRPDPFYRPSSSGSFIINKGIDVGYQYNGSAPDIGRFEY